MIYQRNAFSEPLTFPCQRHTFTYCTQGISAQLDPKIVDEMIESSLGAYKSNDWATLHVVVACSMDSAFGGKGTFFVSDGSFPQHSTLGFILLHV